ncbi:copper amine oxidase [Paenibacillus rhizovicinus]|uniref:Copper amine oxidase n=1 Tax=Paenibacillus rhizovicinus TaxID=2704463 RepID=A0A6C0P773_9BACL|nr:stalk domain-containing protein [Paenibacillus rhizovicinus]QHW34241.1 copper amine oxidase [Paenibacillus rhizovicinus]
MRQISKITVSAAAAAVLLGAVVSTGYAAANNERNSVVALKPLYEVHTIAGSGAYGLLNGTPAESAFRGPTSLLYSDEGKMFLIADTSNQLLRLLQPGEASTAAGMNIGDDDLNASLGSLIDGPVDEAVFNGPSGLAEDETGNVYVADSGNNAIRKIDQDGNVTTIAGDGLIGDTDGAGTKAEFNRPLDIAVSKSGVVYVADTLNHAIRQIKDGVVTTLNAHSSRIVEYVPGSVAKGGDYADGPIAKAKFNEPSGLALDDKGNLYVSDSGNDMIRYIDFAAGTVTTVAGGKAGAAVVYGPNAPYATGGFADGVAGTAKFHAPRGLDLSPEGGLLIADSLNHVIRYLFHGVVSTIAGTPGEEGRMDGLAANGALLNKPTDVRWLGEGTIAVADSGSNTIRLVAPYHAPAGLKTDGTINLLYGTRLLQSDANPVIKNGVTYAPARVLAEQLGYDVRYAGGQTTLRLGTTTYTMTAGSSSVVKSAQGGTKQTLNVGAAPFNAAGRLFLPVRFFAEELGLDVQWLSDIRAVLLRDKRFSE